MIRFKFWNVFLWIWNDVIEIESRACWVLYNYETIKNAILFCVKSAAILHDRANENSKALSIVTDEQKAFRFITKTSLNSELIL